MIGQDFPKIEWHFLGLELLEPNAMLGDIVLFTISFGIAYRIRTQFTQHPFYNYWRLFFIWFGWSFLFGGFGHLLYNYFGLWGKYPSWILSMFATYYLSLAQISLWPNVRQQKLFKTSAVFVLIAGLLIEIYVFNSINLHTDQSKGLVVPSIVSGINMIFSLFVLGLYYQKKYHSNFKFFWIGVLTLLPSALIQSQKINMHQWLDRNDMSHLLLGMSLICYYKGIQAFRSYQN